MGWRNWGGREWCGRRDLRQLVEVDDFSYVIQRLYVILRDLHETCMFNVCIHTYILNACMHTYITLHSTTQHNATLRFTTIHAYIQAYMHTYLATYLQTYLQTHMPTNAPTYTYIYLHIPTYTYIYLRICPYLYLERERNRWMDGWIDWLIDLLMKDPSMNG